MKSSVVKTTLFLFLFVISAQIIDRYFFDQKITALGTVTVKRPASYLFVKLESARFFFRSFVGFKNTIFENDSLKKENLSLLSRLADYEDLKNENDFLRKSLEIPLRFNKKITYANIYQFQLGVDGYDVLLNKGTGSGISKGDIVITEEGVLIGRIEDAHENFSRVLAVSDTDFSVTARVLNSDVDPASHGSLSATAGIAKGALSQGLYFDLIVQSDPIKEGDVIVSSGMDLVPATLMVGTVSYVETNDTDIFKKVKIKPAMGEVRIGRVLIIRKSTN